MSLLKPYNQLAIERKELKCFCVNTNENIFLEGPPWSGKSLIALYTLQTIVEKNSSRSLFMVSNNAMYGYMGIALKELAIDEHVSIDVKNKFFWKVAGEYRISVNMDSDYYENYDSILTNLLDEEIEKEYDLIVVSEVQDYLPKEWEILLKLSERVVCYGDFQQAVYSDKIDRSTILKDCVHKQLNYLYDDASTKKLIGVKDYLFNGGEYVEAKYDNSTTLSQDNGVYSMGVGYSVVDTKYNNELKAIADKMRVLREKKSRVAIICPNNRRFGELSNYFKKHAIMHSYYEINRELRDHNFTLKRPLLLSLFNAEGLQFDDVILFGFDESNYIVEQKREENRLKNVLYVGMTRARNKTYIIRNEDTVKELMEFL